MGEGQEQEEKPKPTASLANDDDSSNNMLRSGIRKAVDATNGFLASLEETRESFRKGPVVKGIHAVESEGSLLAERAVQAYQRRHEYGPHVVVGSALLAGAVVSARRGGAKLPGLLAGAVAGGVSYLAVYESVPAEDVPDLLFGKRKKGE